LSFWVVEQQFELIAQFLHGIVLKELGQSDSCCDIFLHLQIHQQTVLSQQPDFVSQG
jgi:hypothetical protein